MVGIGIRLNPGTIISILSALSDLKDIRQGKCIHGYVFRRGFGSNTEIANQIIYMYAKCGFVHCASRIFKNKRCKDLVSWTLMMMGYLHQGRADEAITLFWLMQRENLSHDSVTLISLLQAFALLGCLNLAKEVHCHVLRVSLNIGIPVINSLITAYSKCGKLGMSRVLFEHMAGRRCLVSWNTMIAAYGMHGRCVQALKLFDQMKKENVVTDDLTFRSVLAACSHSGLVEEGLHIFRSMKEEYSMIPSEDHYGCMIDLLSRAGLLEEAYDLLQCLPPRQSASALGALLAACRVHGNYELGDIVGRWLLDLEPQNPSTYGLVSNIYAGGEKWTEVAQVRAMAKSSDKQVLKMGHRSDLDSKNQFSQSGRWFPYLDKFDAGSMHLNSGEVLEALDPQILDIRKERFRNVAKNQSYSGSIQFMLCPLTARKGATRFESILHLIGPPSHQNLQSYVQVAPGESVILAFWFG
ncbi:unnamed protein product [Ilex paraguariensis]|uniref:Pentatricopeptide repeat-containing protein n=1 Tax=Ilex paraguariensis TaxID=185542 RepID=A0ABC8S2A5_9AQUA